MDRNLSVSGVNNACRHVALRKESVDRNRGLAAQVVGIEVALRKESVDRNAIFSAYL